MADTTTPPPALDVDAIEETIYSRLVHEHFCHKWENATYKCSCCVGPALVALRQLTAAAADGKRWQQLRESAYISVTEDDFTALTVVLADELTPVLGATPHDLKVLAGEDHEKVGRNGNRCIGYITNPDRIDAIWDAVQEAKARSKTTEYDRRNADPSNG